MQKDLALPFDTALASTEAALKAEGFGVLTTVDVKETLRAKLGVDFRRYMILGACNPPLAHRALQADLRVGVAVPCNVVVYERDAKHSVVVAVDPLATMAAASSAQLEQIATEVRAKLARALERINAGATS